MLHLLVLRLGSDGRRLLLATGGAPMPCRGGLPAAAQRVAGHGASTAGCAGNGAVTLALLCVPYSWGDVGHASVGRVGTSTDH